MPDSVAFSELSAFQCGLLYETQAAVSQGLNPLLISVTITICLIWLSGVLRPRRCILPCSWVIGKDAALGHRCLKVLKGLIEG